MQFYYFQSKTCNFYLMQFSIFQKNVYLKSRVYNFYRMVLNLFQGLIYQNDSFYTDCLVLPHSFFFFLLFIVWDICCVSSFVCFFSEFRSFHNSFAKCFIYTRFLIALKCLNFLWCIFIKSGYKLFLEVSVIMFSWQMLGTKSPLKHSEETFE